MTHPIGEAFSVGITALDGIFRTLFVLCALTVVSLPLAIWKVVDIILWLIR